MGLYYYEQKIFSGAWSPRTQSERPAPVSPSGKRRPIRRVQQVPADMELCSVATLQRHFTALEKVEQV